MSNRPIYKLVDSKGRVLIPKNLREAAKDVYKRQAGRRTEKAGELWGGGKKTEESK